MVGPEEEQIWSIVECADGEGEGEGANKEGTDGVAVATGV